MRTIKELLEGLLENKNLFRVGLCQWSSDLRWSEIRINDEECKLLLEYIREHRPSRFSSIDAFKHRKKNFYWQPKDIKPRIEWLKKHIRKNK